MAFFHKSQAWVGLSLNAQKGGASTGLKNELGPTPCRAQQVGVRAFLSRGAPQACSFKHRVHLLNCCHVDDQTNMVIGAKPSKSTFKS